MESKRNPVIYSDFPDPDIIRVDDVYYMASTTMHYMPGCDILRSYDLMNWEFVCHAYETLDDTPGHNLEGKEQIYGQGMWAPSLRYHNGTYYVNFTANDTHKTYLLTASDPAGPWKKRTIEGFYYDSSLFFDEDGQVYIVHGQKEVYLTELDEEVRGPKEGGLHRRVVCDVDEINLGYEGSHLYKKDGRYYLFTCHMLKAGNAWKTEDCFIADSLDGEFKGKCIIDDDMGYHRLGVAQGGMVDTPEGDWYLFMFQDRGALGRAPMLMPMHFDEEGFPVIGIDGKVPDTVTVPSTRPGYVYEPLNGDDDFAYVPDAEGKVHLKQFWQFNHNPVNTLWSVTERPGAYRMYSGKICDSLVYGYNTLTQRTFGPESAAWVTVDGSGLKDGDYAGISAFIGCYAAAALTKEDGRFYLVMLGKPAQNDTVFGDSDFLDPAVEYERTAIDSDCVTLKVHTDFTDKLDEAACYYLADGEWKPLGIRQKQYFKMDHFTGCRFGLFLFSTKQTGGRADFLKFRYWKKD
ncbi:MAG TPA: acetyl xylan esterase [Lachnospiraceae bacterium]|nr:acetyl xylan esterase [Lachnospiraceae bacterium]